MIKFNKIIKESNYKQAEYNMDKFMSENPNDMNKFYKLLDKKDKKGLISFFDTSMSDPERFYSEAGSHATVAGFVDYLLKKK